MESKVQASGRWATIFDLDGVIADTNPVHRRATKAFCRLHGIKVADVVLRTEVFGVPNRQWLPKLLGEELSPAALEALSEEKETLFRRDVRSGIEPLPGLRALLEQLVIERVPRIIASSACRANIDLILQITGLAEYFPAILDDRSYTRGKPDPEIYERAYRSLGLPPGDCVVFEDSLAGVAAARAAGCRVVGVTTTHSAKELAMADSWIEDFRFLTPARLRALVDKNV